MKNLFALQCSWALRRKAWISAVCLALVVAVAAAVVVTHIETSSPLGPQELEKLEWFVGSTGDEAVLASYQAALEDKTVSAVEAKNIIETAKAADPGYGLASEHGAPQKNAHVYE
ncbi:MAG: hypothetical protein ACREPE_08140 [Lysobacter sp.]